MFHSVINWRADLECLTGLKICYFKQPNWIIFYCLSGSNVSLALNFNVWTSADSFRPLREYDLLHNVKKTVSGDFPVVFNNWRQVRFWRKIAVKLYIFRQWEGTGHSSSFGWINIFLYWHVTCYKYQGFHLLKVPFDFHLYMRTPAESQCCFIMAHGRILLRSEPFLVWSHWNLPFLSVPLKLHLRSHSWLTARPNGVKLMALLCCLQLSAQHFPICALLSPRPFPSSST